MDIIIILASVVIVMTGVFKWAAHKDRKVANRRNALQSFAESSDLSYSRDAEPLLGLLVDDESGLERGALNRFHLLRLGRNDVIHNVVSSLTNEYDLHVFDYHFNNRIGSQRTYREWDQSVFLYHQEGLTLPFFSLRPANVLGRFAAAFDRKSRLHEQTGLSANHIISADDKDEVQQLFNSHLVKYCNKHPKLRIEGHGECLILYRRAVLVPADELEAFIQEGLHVFKMIG